MGSKTSRKKTNTLPSFFLENLFKEKKPHDWISSPLWIRRLGFSMSHQLSGKRNISGLALVDKLRFSFVHVAKPTNMDNLWISIWLMVNS